jgi:hypothetical protein
MHFACNIIISLTDVGRVEITVGLLRICPCVCISVLFAFVNSKFQESLCDVKFRIEQKAYEKLDSKRSQAMKRGVV